MTSLRRCCELLSTTTHVRRTLRPSWRGCASTSPDRIDVTVINYPASGRDLVADACKERFGRYKRGEAVQTPDNVQAWSTLFENKIIRGNIPKGFKTIALQHAHSPEPSHRSVVSNHHSRRIPSQRWCSKKRRCHPRSPPTMQRSMLRSMRKQLTSLPWSQLTSVRLLPVPLAVRSAWHSTKPCHRHQWARSASAVLQSNPEHHVPQAAQQPMRLIWKGSSRHYSKNTHSSTRSFQTKTSPCAMTSTNWHRPSHARYMRFFKALARSGDLMHIEVHDFNGQATSAKGRMTIAAIHAHTGKKDNVQGKHSTCLHLEWSEQWNVISQHWEFFSSRSCHENLLVKTSWSNQQTWVNHIGNHAKNSHALAMHRLPWDNMMEWKLGTHCHIEEAFFWRNHARLARTRSSNWGSSHSKFSRVGFCSCKIGCP